MSQVHYVRPQVTGKMNKKQRKVRRKYSVLYRAADDAMIEQLRSLPISAYIDMLPHDHTGTLSTFQELAESERLHNCWDIYYAIVSTEILSYKYVSVADWVNMRDTLTYMMTKFWIGVPKDWGAMPESVSKRWNAILTTPDPLFTDSDCVEPDCAERESIKGK